MTTNQQQKTQSTRMQWFCMRVFALLFLGITSLLCLNSCSANQTQVQQGGQEQQNHDLRQVNVGYWGGLSEAPLFVAKELGLFEKYGIDANLVQLEGSCETWLASYEIDDDKALDAPSNQNDDADTANDTDISNNVDVSIDADAAEENSDSADESADDAQAKNDISNNDADLDTSTTHAEDSTKNSAWKRGTAKSLYAKSALAKPQTVTKHPVRGSEVSVLEVNPAQDAHSSEACVFFATPSFFPAIGTTMDAQLLSEVQRGGIQLCVKSGSEIEKITDLPAKRILTSSRCDMGEIVVKAACINSGLDYDRCNFFAEPNVMKMIEQCDAGECDALILEEPVGALACEYLNYESLFNSAQDRIFKDISYTYLAGNSLVYLDTDLAERLILAIDEACVWISQNPAEAAALIQGNNNSQTSYVVPQLELLSAFGIVYEEDKVPECNLYEDVLRSYSWGSISRKHFEDSLDTMWEVIENAGMVLVE